MQIFADHSLYLIPVKLHTVKILKELAPNTEQIYHGQTFLLQWINSKKSALMLFSNDRATIGVDFSLKVLNWNQQLQLRLELWDLAGQDRSVW